MERARLKNWYFCWNRRNEFSRLELDGGYTGNRYPLWVRLLGKLKKIERASYWRHGNTTIPDQRNYNIQCCNDTTIRYFMWGDSSELKLENNKGSVSDGLHVRKVEKLLCLRIHIWFQYLWSRLPQIYISYLEPIRVSSNLKKIVMLTPWMIIPCLVLSWRHVLHTVSYCYNEQQVIWQV